VTRQNTSEDDSVPASFPVVAVCTVYSMTRTVTGGPSPLRAGLSSARYVPSARTLTGFRAKLADARHRMCAPVARTSRASVCDRKFRSASTSMPGPKDGSRSTARVCSPVVYGPNAAPVSAPVPDSAAATHRTCGNAPSRVALEGRPKNASFSGVAGRSVTDPSTEITRSPQQDTPAAPSAPAGPATCSNSIRSGSAPSFPRARDREEMFGGRHRRPSPASTQPSGSSRPASRSSPRRR